jgi:hypothetical protein
MVSSTSIATWRRLVVSRRCVTAIRASLLAWLAVWLVGCFPAVTPPTPARVVVSIRVDEPLRRISPLIYGVAAAGPAELAATGARLHRWGGNPNSRYNWELGNAWNAARDWEFRNGNYGNVGPADREPSGVADRFVAESRAAGAQRLLTIPALGWVARDDSNNTRSIDVPPGGGPSLNGAPEAIAGYDPTANRQTTSIASRARKGQPFTDPPDRTDGVVYQDEWIYHLVQRFGSAAADGVRYYAIDNEPDLWAETHTDVHPVQLGYDDLVAVFREYALAVKNVDPEARVLGPAVSGWTGYHYAARDRGADNFRSHTERRAHGDMPLLPWWLDQVRQHDETAGRRTLDVLDIHYYPQGPGVYGGATDEATNALRLRSTRSLWDSTYVDESWIREPVRLIPRLREWIDGYYPDTMLAIGEWNWGAERTLNGALAVADVLGIFGREGVDLAAYWTVPPVGSPGALAFAVFTNYDGQGAGFGDLALPAAAPSDLAVYGSRHSASDDLVIVLINKQSSAAPTVTVQLNSATRFARARVFRYDAADLGRIRDLGDAAVAGDELLLRVPASSITLLRVTR